MSDESSAARMPASPNDRGVGKLAEKLILEYPNWTYVALAEEINRQIVGAQASVASVRWYASKMRTAGHDLPRRPRAPKSTAQS